MSRSPSHAAAVARQREVQRILIRHNLPTPLLVDQRAFAGQQCWGVGTFDQRRVEVSSRAGMPGRWFLRMHWLYLEDPGNGDAVLADSSISLNVLSTLTENLNTDCFVRYDYDIRRDPPLHLNVLQPPGIHDRVHFVLPGLAIDEWPVSDVINFLLSEELRNDVVGRLPP